MKFFNIDRSFTYIAIICLLALLSGCADLQGSLAHATRWREDARLVQQDLSEQLQQLESTQDQFAADTNQHHHLQASIEAIQSKINTIQAAITKADLVIEEANNPQDALTQSTKTISQWVPAPAQGPLVLGAALIATLVRSHKLKQSATSIVQSIEHTMQRDPDFLQAFQNNADSIRTIQTPSARKLIDQAQRKQAVQPHKMASVLN